MPFYHGSYYFLANESNLLSIFPSQAAKLLRDRMANLLQDKISFVRSAARFVFRSDPDIIKEVTSSYERRKRAASRREKIANKTETPAK
jgi:hypothetical protein